MGTDTGINFISVSLTELDFKLNKKFKLPKDGVPVDIGVKSKNSFDLNKKKLITTLSVVLFIKTKIPPFVMKASVEGIFIGNNIDDLEKFSKVHAPAHLMPFIREIVGTTTMKAGIPPLLLPPMNLSALFDEKKK